MIFKIFGILVLTAVWMFSVADLAQAARSGPDPLIVQFGQGYGVMRATVVKATALRLVSPDHVAGTYAVSCRVDAIIVQPINREPFPTKAGDTIEVPLSVGYAAHIEDYMVPGSDKKLTIDGEGAALAPGTQYLLTMRFNEDKKVYEHARGASGAKRITPLTEVESDSIIQTAKLAALPLPARLVEEQRLLDDPQAPDFLRHAALSELVDHGWHRQVADAKTQMQAIAKRLWQVWTNPGMKHSHAFLRHLDSALRQSDSNGFDTSDERERVWLSRIFAPLPMGTREENEKTLREREEAVYYLREFGQARPERIGALLIKEMDNTAWPLRFRWRLAAILQEMFQKQDQAQEPWKEALQNFYARAVDAADAYMLRLLVSSLTRGVDQTQSHLPNQQIFHAGPATLAALERALLRMQAQLARPEADPQTTQAIHDIKSALVALGNAITVPASANKASIGVASIGVASSKVHHRPAPRTDPAHADLNLLSPQLSLELSDRGALG